MDLYLKDKHVVIAGGSKGIGLACAKGFLEEGARVTIISRSRENINAALKELNNFEVIGITADLSDLEETKRAIFYSTVDDRGPIDILINCAGSAVKTPPSDLTPDHFRRAMDAKFYTYINTIECVIRDMAARGKGAIVNVVGLGGKVAVPVHLPGGSANAALLLSTAGYASVYIKQGVRVNAVNPIATDTDLLKSSLEADSKMSNITLEEARRAADSKTAIGRILKPKEVADSIIFLSSDRASYINGHMLYLDGGMHPFI
jgi:NAD(P)-dependent dehydrogenase (short-subunit alcohol dehydrogenase family)